MSRHVGILRMAYLSTYTPCYALCESADMRLLCREVAQWLKTCFFSFCCFVVTPQLHAKCISGTDVLRQLHILPHWDGSCTSNLKCHPISVYWHLAHQPKHGPCNTKRLASSHKSQFLSHWGIMIIIMIIIIIIIIAFKGVNRDFSQSSRCVANRLPTRTLKWPGRIRVQITWKTSSASPVQHVLRATWY